MVISSLGQGPSRDHPEACAPSAPCLPSTGPSDSFQGSPLTLRGGLGLPFPLPTCWPHPLSLARSFSMATVQGGPRESRSAEAHPGAGPSLGQGGNEGPSSLAWTDGKPGRIFLLWGLLCPHPFPATCTLGLLLFICPPAFLRGCHFFSRGLLASGEGMPAPSVPQYPCPSPRHTEKSGLVRGWISPIQKHLSTYLTWGVAMVLGV